MSAITAIVETKLKHRPKGSTSLRRVAKLLALKDVLKKSINGPQSADGARMQVVVQDSSMAIASAHYATHSTFSAITRSTSTGPTDDSPTFDRPPTSLL